MEFGRGGSLIFLRIEEKNFFFQKRSVHDRQTFIIKINQ